MVKEFRRGMSPDEVTKAAAVSREVYLHKESTYQVDQVTVTVTLEDMRA